jgi:hypothetical protein
VPLTGVEHFRRREVELPLVVLGPLHRPLALFSRPEPEGILQQPLLRGQQLVPPERPRAVGIPASG